MKSEPVFRQANSADAAAIAAVGAQAWDELGVSSGFTQRPTSDGIAEVMGRERAAIFVCETDGLLCGFSLLTPDADDPEEAVMGVWLVPGARRKGIGRELALMATDFARAAGYRRLRGTLPKDNEPALSFFSDIGGLAQVVGREMQYELPL